MRASLVIAAHNEGERLWKTIRSCVTACAGFEREIIIADDASDDDSVRRAIGFQMSELSAISRDWARLRQNIWERRRPMAIRLSFWTVIRTLNRVPSGV